MATVEIDISYSCVKVPSTKKKYFPCNDLEMYRELERKSTEFSSSSLQSMIKQDYLQVSEKREHSFFSNFGE